MTPIAMVQKGKCSFCKEEKELLKVKTKLKEERRYCQRCHWELCRDKLKTETGP